MTERNDILFLPIFKARSAPKLPTMVPNKRPTLQLVRPSFGGMALSQVNSLWLVSPLDDETSGRLTGRDVALV